MRLAAPGENLCDMRRDVQLLLLLFLFLFWRQIPEVAHVVHKDVPPIRQADEARLGPGRFFLAPPLGDALADFPHRAELRLCLQEFENLMLIGTHRLN